MPPHGFKVFQTRPGPIVDITDQLQNGQPWLHPTQDALLTRTHNSLRAAMYKSGVSIKADIGFFGNGEYYMNVRVYIPKSYGSRPRGFCGTPDGKRGNELYAKGATTPISPPLTDRRLYSYLLTCKSGIMYYYNLKHVYVDGSSSKYNRHQHVIACIHTYMLLLIGRVPNEENLFLPPPVIPTTQPPTTQPLTTQPPTTLGPTVTPTIETLTTAPTADDWVPIFLDELNFTTEQKMICGENIQCLFDLNVTDEMDVAVTTLNHSVETEETREVISELCYNL